MKEVDLILKIFNSTVFFCLLSALSLGACTKKETAVPAPKLSGTLGTMPTLVIIGDSLTEGYGVPKEKAYPFLVEEKFASKDVSVRVVNSGISGSTSASAPERVKWALQTKPQYLVLALGANDGLRGLSPSSMKENLGKAIDMAQTAGVQVLLFGMLMPPNFGKKYTGDFEKVFKDLAAEKKIPLLPFPLKDVGGVAALNQGDGIHPNEKGHEIMANTVYEFLKEHVK